MATSGSSITSPGSATWVEAADPAGAADWSRAAGAGAGATGVGGLTGWGCAGAAWGGVALADLEKSRDKAPNMDSAFTISCQLPSHPSSSI
jgi:hypothetical protein